MKSQLIPAWIAEDGKIFLNEAECIEYDSLRTFENWYSGQQVNFQSMADVLHWLIKNAEDIRGFLPPTAAKPELDIHELTRHAYLEGVNSNWVVKVPDVTKWLKGELK